MIENNITNSPKLERIVTIDSIRGFSAVLLFLHHFLLFFFPRTYWGDQQFFPINVPKNLELFYLNSPISFITNGQFFVCVFLLVSSFVLCYQIRIKPDLLSCSRLVIKKLPELSIPLFLISLITWGMMRSGAFNHYEVNRLLSGSFWAENRFQDSVKFLDIFRISFITVWIQGGSPFSSAYWMLNYIFLGQLFSLFLSICAFKLKPYYRRCVYLLVLIILLQLPENYHLYIPIVLGCVLCDEYIEKKIVKSEVKENKLLFFSFVFMGCFLGGCPTETKPTGIYVFFSNISPVFIHSFGAFFFCMGIIFAEPVILRKRLFLFLGKISYSFYLIHFQILFSFSQILFSLLYFKIHFGYIKSCFIVCVFSIFIVCVISFVFEYTIRRYSRMLVKKIISHIYS